MKPRAVIIACLLTVVALSCESAHQQLNSIDELKNIGFGQSVQKHTLLLLHWFANKVDIEFNNVVHLNFNPNTEFGSHYYGNRERILDPLPQGYQYYTVGSLSQSTSSDLPDYVRHPPVREYVGTNMDRIIFRVQEQYPEVRRIDRVYITQHNRMSNSYDPEHTYQITTNLLREIRMFSIGNQRTLSELRDQFHSSAEDYQLRDIRNTWGSNLACVGLMLFIVIHDKYSNYRPVNKNPQAAPRQQKDYVLDMPDASNNNATENCGPECCLGITIFCLFVIAVIGFIIYRYQGG